MPARPSPASGDRRRALQPKQHDLRGKVTTANIIVDYVQVSNSRCAAVLPERRTRQRILRFRTRTRRKRKSVALRPHRRNANRSGNPNSRLPRRSSRRGDLPRAPYCARASRAPRKDSSWRSLSRFQLHPAARQPLLAVDRQPAPVLTHGYGRGWRRNLHMVGLRAPRRSGDQLGYRSRQRDTDRDGRADRDDHAERHSR